MESRTSGQSVQEVLFLHISDLHARVKNRRDIELRVKALFKDLEKNFPKIDVVLFTGDLTFAGKKEEYELVKSVLLDPLASKFHIPHSSFLIIPGNHDVDREKIDWIEEEGLQVTLNGDTGAYQFFTQDKYHKTRLSEYFSFTKNFGSGKDFPYYTSELTIKNISIGFACFNSAWRCSGDDDKGRLFLTEEQVGDAATKLNDSPIKIALVHHPEDWFHTKDSIAMEDINRQFEIIVSGHLHTNHSVSEETPAHKCLRFTCPALYEGKLAEGYNIYRLQFADRKFIAHYRKYIRKRNDFDKDTEHATDGTHAFSLPVKEFERHTQLVLAQRIGVVSDKMQAKVKESLQRIQSVEEPVFVTPKIFELSWKDGIKQRLPCNRNLSDIAGKKSVIYGPKDSGKSILLQTIASDLNTKFQNKTSDILGIYLDLKEIIPLKCSEQVESYVSEYLRNELLLDNPATITLLVDNIQGEESLEFEAFYKAAEKNKWSLTASINNELLLELLAREKRFEGFEFFEIGYWGPSRIREFVIKYFNNASVDINAAYNFVTNSLKESDLPASPTILAMYLSIFPTLGSEVSSLSFLRLLEKIEQVRLDSIENTAEHSLYNKRAILMQIAKKCFDLKVFELPIEECESLIKIFFESKLLTVNPNTFLKSLVRSGILSIDRHVQFSYYDFYDYYLAQAFKEKIIDVNKCLNSVEACVSVSRALSLYGGLFRENSDIAESVFNFVSKTFRNKSEFTLKDLERYITSLLEPIDNQETPDGAASKTLKKKVDYEKYDDDYEKSKQKVQEDRRIQLLLKPPISRADELGLSVQALKTFYNLFRNLENLDGEVKVKYLDAILDFHIQLNLDLIDFLHGLSKDQNREFHTLTAYLITISGQIFLSSNIGNQSLHKAIERTIKSCTNDLKKLLLVSLYSELRLPGYSKRLKEYVEESKSLAAVEIAFIQIKHLMITYDKPEIPATLISAFHAAFTQRQKLYGDDASRGSFTAYNDALNQTKKLHLAIYYNKDGATRLASTCS